MERLTTAEAFASLALSIAVITFVVCLGIWLDDTDEEDE